MVTCDVNLTPAGAVAPGRYATRASRPRPGLVAAGALHHGEKTTRTPHKTAGGKRGTRISKSTSRGPRATDPGRPPRASGPVGPAESGGSAAPAGAGGGTHYLILFSRCGTSPDAGQWTETVRHRRVPLAGEAESKRERYAPGPTARGIYRGRLPRRSHAPSPPPNSTFPYSEIETPPSQIRSKRRRTGGPPISRIKKGLGFPRSEPPTPLQP